MTVAGYEDEGGDHIFIGGIWDLGFGIFGGCECGGEQRVVHWDWVGVVMCVRERVGLRDCARQLGWRPKPPWGNLGGV